MKREEERIIGWERGYEERGDKETGDEEKGLRQRVFLFLFV